MSSSAPSISPAVSRSDLYDGARAMAAMLPAYVPFGLVVGAAIANSANPLAAWLATWTIYGAAAHLAVLDVLAQGSGWPAAAVVGLLVNARLAAYATSMAPEWRSAPLRVRAVADLLVTDAPWALARGRLTGQRQFYLGAAVTLFSCWPALVTLDVLLGGWVGAVPVTHLLPPLALAAMVVPHLRQRPAAAAVPAAVVCAVLTQHLSAGVSLAVAGALGTLVGVLVERT